MDATARALLLLCLGRAFLLRRALEALVASMPSAHWCTWAMDKLDTELNAIKKVVEALEGRNDGRDSD